MHNFVFVVTGVEHHLTVKVLGFLCFTQERVTEEGKFTSFHLLTSGNSSDGLTADCRKGVTQSLAVSFSVILCICCCFPPSEQKVPRVFCFSMIHQSNAKKI